MAHAETASAHPPVAKRAFELLGEAAIRAPSADNNQPWDLEIDESGGRLIIRLDAERDHSETDERHWLSRMAIGAALENILRISSQHDWELDVSVSADGARVEVDAPRVDADALRIDPIITQRVTNRRVYDARAISQDTLTRLRNLTPELNGIHTHWVVDRDRIEELANLIRRADAIMFADPRARASFLKHVRFDAADDEEVTEGLSLASLELTGLQGSLFRFLTRKSDWVLRLVRFGDIIANHSRQLVQSASGVCLLSAPDESPVLEVAAGRAMQRAWLAMTESNLAVQPMMSLIGLQRSVRHHSDRSTQNTERIASVVQDFQSRCPEFPQGHQCVCIMRFGHSDGPSGRCGRLSLADVARISG